MIRIAFGLLANMALGFNTYATHLNTKRTETSFYYIVLYLEHSGVFPPTLYLFWIMHPTTYLVGCIIQKDIYFHFATNFDKFHSIKTTFFILLYIEILTLFTKYN